VQPSSKPSDTPSGKPSRHPTSKPSRLGTQPSGSPSTILPQLDSYQIVTFTSISTLFGLDSATELSELEIMAFRIAIAGTMLGIGLYIYIFI
jgi:hypothetical protein